MRQYAIVGKPREIQSAKQALFDADNEARGSEINISSHTSNIKLLAEKYGKKLASIDLGEKAPPNVKAFRMQASNFVENTL